MNIYLVVILFILIAEYVLECIVETFNMRAASGVLPEEFSDVYDAKKYEQSQAYLKENTRFFLIKTSLILCVTVIFILIGGFNFVDIFARSFGLGPIMTGLIFGGSIIYLSQLLDIPFAAYKTFVIETKYGFNKTTPKTFLSDILKTWVLIALIGGIIFSGIIWFFRAFGALAWFYCWIALSIFQLFLTFIAPIVILPLFNKFVPLGEGALKDAIYSYARSQRFALSGIFTMDASRRSTKSNAFFTGFGKYRRIALFDTLIEKHTVDELVSVLAHEIGHYKKKHFIKGVVFSVLTSGLMFYILSFFINNPGLFAAFKMQHVSIYGSLFFFGFLYTPINFLFSIVQNVLSRKHEYEADRFAVTTYGTPDAFISALKKLTVDNLSNLTPHPVKVFLDYSHPPVPARIRAIRALYPRTT